MISVVIVLLLIGTGLYYKNSKGKYLPEQIIATENAQTYRELSGEQENNTVQPKIEKNMDARTPVSDEKIELALREYTRAHQVDVYSTCYEGEFGRKDTSGAIMNEDWKPVYFSSTYFDFDKDGVDEIIVSGEACTSGTDINHVDAVFKLDNDGSLVSIPFETNQVDEANLRALSPEYVGQRLGDIGNSIIHTYSYHKPGDVGDDGTGRVRISYVYGNGKFVSQAVMQN